MTPIGSITIDMPSLYLFQRRDRRDRGDVFRHEGHEEHEAEFDRPARGAGRLAWDERARTSHACVLRWLVLTRSFHGRPPAAARSNAPSAISAISALNEPRV